MPILLSEPEDKTGGSQSRAFEAPPTCEHLSEATPLPQVRIIPLQLQRLFAQLLLLDQEAASTTDLTDSFGWTSEEVGRGAGRREVRVERLHVLSNILILCLRASAHWNVFTGGYLDDD